MARKLNHKVLKAAMEANSYNSRVVAEKMTKAGCKVSGASVQNWAIGKSIPQDDNKIVALAAVLDIDPAELTGGKTAATNFNGYTKIVSMIDDLRIEIVKGLDTTVDDEDAAKRAKILVALNRANFAARS